MGRPRAFDPDEALDKAMLVFWSKGYEGTSLTDLTDAMGINRPSLYSAFGNKEELFRKALERYSSKVACADAAFRQPTARAFAEKYLNDIADGLTDPTHPRGCMGVMSALVCSDEAGPVREELISCRRSSELAVRARLMKAQEDGDLCPDTNPADLARYIATIAQGMSVQSVSGATREELRRTVELALRAWPR